MAFVPYYKSNNVFATVSGKYTRRCSYLQAIALYGYCTVMFKCQMQIIKTDVRRLIIAYVYLSIKEPGFCKMSINRRNTIPYFDIKVKKDYVSVKIQSRNRHLLLTERTHK